MQTEIVLDLIARTLRAKLDCNNEPCDDLVKVVTDAIIDAELANDRLRMENQIRDKQRRYRSVVLNGIKPITFDELKPDPRYNVRSTDNGYADISTDD